MDWEKGNKTPDKTNNRFIRNEMRKVKKKKKNGKI